MTGAEEVVTEFSAIKIRDLVGMTTEQLDALPYGVVGLSDQGVVEIYNSVESRSAGLPSSTVIGFQFFLSVAQCMNNFMVAQRFEDETELDVILRYVLTFRMRPKPVTLRLLKTEAVSRSYLLIQH